MKTVVRSYKFDISNPKEKMAWETLKETLAAWPHRMKSVSMRGEKTHHQTGKELDGQTITLETEHLFNNQWNTAPIEGISETGLRVFDWAQDALFDHRGNPNTIIKQGYYLTQTAEMKEIRRNTAACGYCGKQEPAAKGYVFCPNCLDSEYLKESDLFMLRMRPVEVDRFSEPSRPLTDAETAYLLPLYREAQLHGSTERGKKRIAKAKADIETEYTRSIAHATEKREAARWIVARFPGLLSNWIYYSHADKHTFGWRTPLDKTQADALLEVISEFPFGYELILADGRKLSAVA